MECVLYKPNPDLMTNFNKDELSLILGVQGILGPFYPEIPVSLGVRYGF